MLQVINSIEFSYIKNIAESLDFGQAVKDVAENVGCITGGGVSLVFPFAHTI